MKRQAKFFLDVDGEGMLIDTLGIVADVNFDCYESIVSSCQRIIAAYKETLPEYVTVLKLFYYKKRARSARMNPVRIYTTTDVFRAVAEHPTGDIPLGVQWKVQRVPARDVPKWKVEPKLTLQDLSEVYKEEKENSSASSKRKTAEDIQDFLEKKRKTEIIYKTYMPDSTNISNISQFTNVSTLTTTGGQTLVGGQLPVQTLVAGPGQTLVAGQLPVQKLIAGRVPFPPNKSSASPSPDPNKKASAEQEDRQTFQQRIEKETRMKYSVSKMKNYQWPDEVRCEFVMTYGGITERQVLPISVTNHVLNVVREQCGATSKGTSVTETSSQSKLSDMCAAVKERISEKKKPKVPIKNIQDAKMEFFKVFSSLNLSKARFDSLLDWLKSLQLEEGKQGKFFLTERTRIGTGLKILYDTDELAANKLNQLYRARSKENAGKTLHPLIAAPKLPENPQPPLMLVVPGGQPSVTTTSVAPQFVASPQIQLMPHPKISHMNTATKASTAHDTTLSSSNNLESNHALEETAKSSSSLTKRTGPTILRRNSLKEKKKNIKKKDPVPMHLYRAYNTGNGTDNTSLILSKSQNFPEVKTEPVSQSEDETETGDEDSDCHNSGALVLNKDKYHNLMNALKSDAQLPQSVDQTEKQFEYVTVKTEPLDDY